MDNDSHGTDTSQMSEPTVDEHGRPEPPLAADQVATLTGFIEFLRATMAWRTSGLSDEELNRCLQGHPSPMTLGGMLKHLTFVESYWFECVVLGIRPSEPWDSVDWSADSDWDWHSAADDSGDQIRALWQAQVARSREIVDGLLGAGQPVQNLVFDIYM